MTAEKKKKGDSEKPEAPKDKPKKGAAVTTQEAFGLVLEAMSSCQRVPSCVHVGLNVAEALDVIPPSQHIINGCPVVLAEDLDPNAVRIMEG